MKKLSLILIIGSLLLLPAESQSILNSETKKLVTTKLHFYLQDVTGGDNPRVWVVAKSNLTDVLPSGFGKVLVSDNLITLGPDITSGEVGRLQGTATLSDLGERALAMVLNLVFTQGEFEGSTLSFLGRNPLDAKVREIPIVGGTGAFRMATGYMISSPYFIDPAGVRSVYEYNAFVFHRDPSAFL